MEQLIKTLFNINKSDIERLDTVQKDDELVVYLLLKRKEVEYCPICGKKLTGNGKIEKKINHKVLTDRKVTLVFIARRYRCKACNFTKFEKNPIAMDGFYNSILTINQVMMDLRDPNYNYTMIAQKNDVNVNDVINYFDSYVVIPPIHLPSNMGIDEIHSDMAKRKDASYLGVITDNDNFKLIEILPSRSKYELNNYFSTFSKEEREKVRYVTTDLWLPYKEVSKRWLPNAVVAADPFHVIKHLCDDFTHIRIRIMNKSVYGSNSYYLLKKWHKLLESDDYNFNGEAKYNHVFKQKLNYGDIRKMILEIDDELNLAYELKEAYRYFNSNAKYESAQEELDTLISMFTEANIKEYEEFIGIMKNWRQEIINSFIICDITGNRLSNAKSETMNSQIKTHIRISKGLGNFNRFRKRMLYCYNDKLFCIVTEKLTSMKRNLKKKKKEDKTN